MGFRVCYGIMLQHLHDLGSGSAAPMIRNGMVLIETIFCNARGSCGHKRSCLLFFSLCFSLRLMRLALQFLQTVRRVRGFTVHFTDATQGFECGNFT
jgi:hypothetical protein